MGRPSAKNKLVKTLRRLQRERDPEQRAHLIELGRRALLNWFAMGANNLLKGVLPVNKLTERFIQSHRQDLSIIANKHANQEQRKKAILKRGGAGFLGGTIIRHLFKWDTKQKRTPKKRTPKKRTPKTVPKLVIKLPKKPPVPKLVVPKKSPVGKTKTLADLKRGLAEKKMERAMRGPIGSSRTPDTQTPTLAQTFSALAQFRPLNTSTPKQKYKCRYCPLQYNLKSSRDHHEKTVHGGIYKPVWHI